jgi:hypothetical protein
MADIKGETNGEVLANKIGVGDFVHDQTGKRGEVLRYPLSIGRKDAPAIMFNIHKATYDPKGTVVSTGSGHIALYMTQGVSFKDAIIYEEKQTGVGGSMMDAEYGIKELFKSATTKETIAAAAATTEGKAVGAALLAKFISIPAAAAALASGGIADSLLKETQEVLRENPFIFFKGVGLREWSFTWSFIPESEEESMAAKNIINRFRLAMYPQKTDFTLHFPEVFNIEFINANFPKMPEVVLQGCDISYNKDSNSFFVENSEPVRIDMTLNFKELSAIYYSHIKQGY